ncbi:MAG: hypothetical protein QOJ65_966 [Fimbriimonadaceae bacterium]|jgi:hypothetical protein|nr:hypothetical protein [Fimbriimonadaceae bacterium]
MLVALCLLALAPLSAFAQFDINKLYGKNHAQVMKMLGKPLETAGKPINYATFKMPGTIYATVWYFFDTGIVSKVQIGSPASDRDYEKQLKKFGLSIGPNPRPFNVLPPAISLRNRNAVVGLPWSTVFVSYLYAMPFKAEFLAYCKAKGLEPTKTWFWTIQTTSRKTAGSKAAIGG